MRAHAHVAAAAVAAAATLTLGLGTATDAASASAATVMPAAYLSHFHKLTTIASTVPRNGDVNPYGIVIVRRTTGRLRAGNVLISNFNDKANRQGTGTTIVQVTPGGQRSVFAHVRRSSLPGACPGGIGLTTALSLLPGGWVVVGSTPSRNGMATTAKAGCLLVINNRGQVVRTITGHGINGPWDSTAVAGRRFADLFVTNVLNGTVAGHGKVVRRGTVVRLTMRLRGSKPPVLTRSVTVGSGFPEQVNAAAFVLGPTGVGLGRGGWLYVASTQDNRITRIGHALTRMTSAGTGHLVTKGGQLLMPLGLAIAPGGHVLTVNGGNGKIVETTPGGTQVAWRFLDTTGSPKGAGALFGLAVRPGPGGVYYVDDAANTLRLLH